MPVTSDARARARRLVDFWRSRQWLRSPSPVHVHPLDLTKLEELITMELTANAGNGQDEARGDV
jgi:hypothetical protein